MSKMKVVVLEKSGSRYTVLGQDGSFRQINRRLNAEVGEEVLIQIWPESFSGVRLWAVAVAVALFLLVFTTLLGWNLYQVPTAVALLSVDINPSLQFELDNQGHLLKFQTQNEDAKRMLSQTYLKGKPIEEVLEQIVTQAYDQKFLSSEQNWVVVGYSPMNNKTLEQMPKELNENQIILWVTEISEKKGLTPQVAVFSLTSQERELAQKGDLTLGEYALWQTADKAGVVTQPEKLKDNSERARLLENPQINVQIKAEKNERQSVIPQKPRTSKQDSGLIGKLDEDGTGKLLRGGKLFLPFKVLDPWKDKSRSRDADKDGQKDNDNYTQKDQDNAKDKQKEQNNDNYMQKNQDNPEVEDNKKAKDQENYQENYQGKYQEKYQNKDQSTENKETQRTKYNNSYVPQILTPRNLRHDASLTNKLPENGRDKQQRH